MSTDKQIQQPVRLTINNPEQLRQGDVPWLINRDALQQVLAQHGAAMPFVIDRSTNPAVFRDARNAAGGLGQQKITPFTQLKGDVSCGSPAPLGTHDTITLTVRNRSKFAWKLSTGEYPIGVGVHVLAPSGTRITWDNGFRVQSHAYVPAGSSAVLSVPVASLGLARLPAAPADVVLDFELLQDGNAWVGEARGNGECQVRVDRGR